MNFLPAFLLLFAASAAESCDYVPRARAAFCAPAAIYQPPAQVFIPPPVVYQPPPRVFIPPPVYSAPVCQALDICPPAAQIYAPRAFAPAYVPQRAFVQRNVYAPQFAPSYVQANVYGQAAFGGGVFASRRQGPLERVFGRIGQRRDERAAGRAALSTGLPVNGVIRR